MNRGAVAFVSLLVAVAFGAAPADAGLALRKKVERHFPDRAVCSFRDELDLAFIAGSSEATLTFSATGVDSEPVKIDDVVVVERDRFADLFKADPFIDCMNGTEPFYRGDGSDLSLEDDPGEWNLTNAGVDGSLHLGIGEGAEAVASVRVTGLVPGREYFVTGFSDRGDFDVEVDDTPPPAFYLLGGRFKVEVRWDLAGKLPAIRPLSEKTTALSFGDPQQFVMLVSAINKCQPSGNGTYWLMFAGTPSQKLRITISDTVTGVRKTYLNAANTQLKTVVDKTTFRCR
jgi:hypothetical protein